ncbi:hypothetical protein [Gracilimonas sp.]|uniref:hypothetical protein n=1 Tax=Gracilimonas sp. TaxID=1974203 RepID=UPI0028727656|nr:hypothetical protein [Gracilimonas sp.]
MKKLRFYGLSLLILFFVASCTLKTENQQQPYVYAQDEELVEALDEVLENQVALGRIAGGVAMVSKEDTIIARKAWGWNNREE